MPSGFQLITGCSLAGLGAIALLTTARATTDQTIWQRTEHAKSELQARADLEEKQAEAAKYIADAYAKNQIARFDKLLIRGYIFNDQPPQVTWSKYLTNPDQRTLIYDENRLCVGMVHHHRFYFVTTYPNVCEAKL